MSNRLIGLTISIAVHAVVLASVYRWNQTDADLVQHRGGISLKLAVSMFEPAKPVQSLEAANRQAQIDQNEPDEEIAPHNNNSAMPEVTVQRTPIVKPVPVATPTPKPKPKPKTTPTEPNVEAKPRTDTEVRAKSQASASDLSASKRTGSGEAIDNRAGVEDAYKSAIQRAILDQRRYPRQARRKRAEGTVVVFLELARDGRVNELRILQSSGVTALDKAALDAVLNVGSFEPFPDEVERPVWDFEFPVIFSLR